MNRVDSFASRPSADTKDLFNVLCPWSEPYYLYQKQLPRGGPDSPPQEDEAEFQAREQWMDWAREGTAEAPITTSIKLSHS